METIDRSLSKTKTHLSCIVVQPTSLCNLNCSYCYLPDRRKRHEMPIRVAEHIAEGIKEIGVPIKLIWHGGEPLACGVDHLDKLMTCFSGCSTYVDHYIQTNGTLINDHWCDVFQRHRVAVGVSLDGPDWLNRRRVDWRGRESFLKATEGISLLRHRGISYSVIAVIGQGGLDHAKSIFEFFRDFDCISLGINIEELEGDNQQEMVDDDRVTEFWRSLFIEWKRDPSLRVREFVQLVPWLARYNGLADQTTPWASSIDIFPSIAYNGDVVLLSPEFLAASRDCGSQFVVGNVSSQPLKNIIECAHDAEYVEEFFKGVAACRESCDYFDFCGGGQASNKFFEKGRLDATDTTYCKNGRIRVIDAILQCA